MADRNILDLVERTHDREDLARLLRACGAEEAHVLGQSSDFDRFLALAEVLPLCGGQGMTGHPLYVSVLRVLQEATAIAAPLCPHTARAFWEAWVDTNWYGRTSASRELPPVCPCCAPPALARVSLATLHPLPDPCTVTAPHLGEWTRILESAWPESDTPPVCTLPEGYTFIRPNPYHAGEAIRALVGGQALTESQRDLLWAQALRVWGQRMAATAAEQGRIPTRLCLRGGRGEEVARLIAYLKQSKALGAILWFPAHPSEAACLCGLYREVGTGVDLSSIRDEGVRAEALSHYGEVAPLGRAVILEI